ncbi:MAG: MFS transporter [Actinomycetota bacterium]
MTDYVSWGTLSSSSPDASRPVDAEGDSDGEPSPSKAPTALLTPEFLALTAVSTLFFAGAGVLNALLPLFVVDELGGSEAIVGTVMGSMALPALLSRPLFGRMADRHGARRILFVGALVAATAVLLLVLLPPSLPAVFASRLVFGAGAAAMLTGAAMRSLQLAPPDRQSQGTSLALVAIHLGLGLGPILGVQVLRRYDFDAVWVAVVVLMVASAGVGLLLTPTPRSVTGPPAPLVHRAALLPGLVTLLGVFAFNGFVAFASLYGREVGVVDVSLIFTVLSGSVIVARLVGSRVPDLIGPILAGSGALVVTVIAALVVGWWATPVGVFVGAVLMAAGLSLQSPSFIPLAMAGVPDHQRGAAMATFTGFYDVANALIGPSLGLIVVGFGYRTAFTLAAVVAVAALILLNVAVAPRWRRITAPGELSAA